MIIKKIFNLLLQHLSVVLLSFFSLTSISHANETISISQYRLMENTPPFIWFDEYKQRREGLVPYLQERLFREVDLDVQRVLFDTSNTQQRTALYQQLAMGDIDALGFSIHLPRILKFASFIDEPLFEVDIKIYVARGKSFDYQGWSSLKGKKGGGVGIDYRRRLNFHPALAEYADKNFTLITLVSRDEAIEQLLAGDIDYWIDSNYITQNLIIDRGYQERIVAIATPLATLPFYMAISKQSPYHGLVAELTKNLRQLRDSGEYQQIEDRYLQRYLDYYRERKKSP